MRIPRKPPDWRKGLRGLVESLDRFDPDRYLPAVQEINRLYLPWDKVSENWRVQKWGDLDPVTLWTHVQLTRLSTFRNLKLVDKHDRPFKYSIPDSVLQGIHDVARYASPEITAPDGRIIPSARKYLQNSIMEEAIASSQIEGAATTRKAAKEMLRSRRSPRTYGERMILNNYTTILLIKDMLDQDPSQPLTIGMLNELHRSMTKGTLEEQSDAGRFRTTDDVIVVDRDTEEVLHVPPPHAQLDERVQRVCDFANAKPDDAFIPPVLRAAILHFMIGYDHPYVDGNGRTARALFYWYMLKHGYPAIEYLAISRVILQARAQYVRAYLRSENEDGDLTYFLIFHLRMLQRSLDKFARYVAKKRRVQEEALARLRRFPDLNHRQVAILDHALRHPDARYTFHGHAEGQGVTYMTARADLLGLMKRGFLESVKAGRQVYLFPAKTLPAKLGSSKETD